MDLYEPPGNSLRESMSKLVSKFHPELVGVVDRIALVFREKAGKSGGQVVLGKSSKASKLVQVLGAKEWVFVIELAADEWQGMDERTRAACLDHFLCCCGVSYDENTDETKYFIRKPPISVFPENIRRWGMWMEFTDDSQEEAGSIIEQMFLEPEDSEPMALLVSLVQRGYLKVPHAYSVLGIDRESLAQALAKQGKGDNQ